MCEIKEPSLPCLLRRCCSIQTNLPWSLRLQEKWGKTFWNWCKIKKKIWMKLIYFPVCISSRFGVLKPCRSDAMLWLTGLWPRAGLRGMWWPCTWRVIRWWSLCGWGWPWWVWRPHSSTTTFGRNRCCTALEYLELGPWCLEPKWLKVGGKATRTRHKDAVTLS